MKNFYPRLLKFCFFCLLILSTKLINAQIAKGDIAFTGYTSLGASASVDTFSFVLLNSISVATTVNFTTTGWIRTTATTGNFRATAEEVITLTFNPPVAAGKEVKVYGTTATYGPGGSAPPAITVSGTPLTINGNGDQIIVYTGTQAAPTFITAIHTNVYSVATGIPGVPGGDATTTTAAAWDGTIDATFASGLPGLAGSNFLTTGTDAIWIPGTVSQEYDNAKYNCTGSLVTPAQVRASVYNYNNWTKTDNDPAGFSLPTGCNFLGIIPIKLVSFDGKNNGSNIGLYWESIAQTNFSHFELERSYNNNDFSKIVSINGTTNASGKYNFSDYNALQSGNPNIFYRLKIIDKDLKFEYSGIVSVKNTKKGGVTINNLSNPVKDRINFTLVAKYAGKAQIQVTDANGSIIVAKSILVNAGSNTVDLQETAGLSKGTYFLKVTTTEGSVVSKVIK